MFAIPPHRGWCCRGNGMTLPRILTALVLIPAVVALVWFAPTFLVAVLAALVMLLALFEFFVLGAHAGMQGYRVWTGLCALAIFYSQWLAAASHTANAADADVARFADLAAILSFEHILILFVLGAAAIVIFAKQPVNEALGSVSLSAAAILFLVFPLSSIIRIHGAGVEGRKLLLFTLVLVWAGDTLAYFVGKSIGQWRLAPHLSPQENLGGCSSELGRFLACGRGVYALVAYFSQPGADHGCARQYSRAGRRSDRIRLQAQRRRKGLRHNSSGSWRHAGSNRCADPCRPRGLVLFSVGYGP